MSLEQSIQNLADAINNLASRGTAVSEAPGKTVPKGTSKPADAPKPTPVEDVKETPPGTPAAPAFDDKQLKESMLDLLNKNKDKGLELFAKYGAKKLGEVKEEDRPALLADVKSALESLDLV